MLPPSRMPSPSLPSSGDTAQGHSRCEGRPVCTQVGGPALNDGVQQGSILEGICAHFEGQPLYHSALMLWPSLRVRPERNDLDWTLGTPCQQSLQR